MMRAIIVDDHAMVRRGLSMLLAKLFDGIEIEGASDIAELVDKVADGQPPDIVLLDLLLPGVHGMEGLDIVRQRLPGVPVAIVSASEDVDDIVASIEHGARGFILKSSDEKVLKLAVSLVLSGEIYVPSRALEDQKVGWPGKLGGRSGRESGRPRDAGRLFPVDNPFNQLTERERSVLRLLMRGQSNKEIGRNLDLVEGTVKKYVRMIFRKLDVTSRTRAVIMANQLGWPPDEGDGTTKVPKPADDRARA